jgi:TP901 family phage tail tape measure protein
MDKSFGLSILIGAALGGAFKSTFSKADKASKSLGDTIADTNKKIGATKSVIKYRDALAKLKARQKQLGGSNQAIEKQIERVVKQYRAARKSARAYGIEIRNVDREQARLNTQLVKTQKLQQANSRRDRNRDTRSNLRSRFAGVAAAGFVGAGLLTNSLGVEEAAIRLDTVINTEDTAAALAKSRRHALDFAKKSLTTEAEILNIEYALNSAGLDAEAARLGSEIVSKVAKVTSGSGEQVGEVIGTVFNNLSETIVGDTRTKIATIGDILTKTQFKFQIRDFGQLGESFAKGAKASVRYKVSLQQTAAVLGQLNSTGVQGAEAGTAYNAILRQMGKASDDLGFAIERDAKGSLDLIATIGNLKEALDDYSQDTDERAAAIQKSFGDEGGAVSLLIDQYGKLSNNYEDVAKNSKGLVNKSYQKFLDGAPGQVKLFTDNLRLMSNTIIGTTLPVLNAVLAPVTSLFGGIASLASEFPAFGAVIGTATLGLVGFTVAAWAGKFVGTLMSDAWLLAGKTLGWFGKVLTFTRGKLLAFNAAALVTSVRTKALAAGSLIAGFASSVGALATRALPLLITAWRGVNLAFLASPIGLIIGGIALASGLIIANWSKVSDFFSGFWDKIKSGWQSFTGFLSKALSSGPFGLLLKGLEKVTSFFSDDKATVKPGTLLNQPTVIGSNSATSSGFKTAAPIESALTAANDQVKSSVFKAVQTVQAAQANQQAQKVVTIQKLELHVHAAPGQSPDEIAEAVMEKINGQSALYDADGI